MTSPDRFTPTKAFNPSNLFELQNATPETEAGPKNDWLRLALEEIRDRLLNDLLGGFNNIVEGIGEGIESIILAIIGQPGGLAQLRAWAEGIQADIEDIPIIGDFFELITGIPDSDDADAASWIRGRINSLFGITTEIIEVEVPRLDNRIDELGGIGTRSTFYSSGPFHNPGPGKTVGVALFNGGSGLTGAKYLYQEFISDDLVYPVAVTVGGPGQVSRFGSYLAGSWTTGGIVTAQGILDGSLGDAGDGGVRNGSSGSVDGGPGGGNLFAAGGQGATLTTPATKGQDAPLDKVAMVGGGGGGAGYSSAVIKSDGANGGWPGGGGGQSGSSTITGAANEGVGGYGGVIITVKG